MLNTYRYAIIAFCLISTTCYADSKLIQEAIVKTEQFRELKKQGEDLLNKHIGLKNLSALLIVSKIAQGEISYKFSHAKLNSNFKTKSLALGVQYDF